VRAPPATVAPERLFRLLLATPRPIARLAWCLPGAEHIALHVRALTGLETQAVIDTGANLWRGLVAASLMTDDGPAFLTPDLVGHMPSHLFDAMSADVRLALDTVSPTYVLSDVAAWHAELIKGAKHPSNWYLVREMANCVDVSLGPGQAFIHERPDRYFGLPVRELTDGHLMAYRAARAATETK
jgi:hypothetical protein